MFFSDGSDGAGIDTSGAGFLSIFGSNAGADASSDTPSNTSLETDSQDGATDADASTPEGTADAQDLTAADVVAERIAASLAEDGIELPEPDAEDEDDADDGAIDFENLTPAELKALAKEFQEFKAQQAASTDEVQKTTVRQKVEAAEAAAVEQVEQAYEQAYEREVLTKSASHYRAELNKRVAGIVRAAKNQDDPDTYTIQSVIAAAFAVIDSKEQHEREQAEAWGPALVEARTAARLEARKQVPELRDYYARRLAEKYDLPDAVIADIAHPQRHIDTFEFRAKELADMAAHEADKAKKRAQAKRQDANKDLQGRTARTSSTGRLPGGKPRQYATNDDKRRAEEGAAILATFRQ